MKHTIPFVPRIPELLALEGNHNGIILSCRHKDILRCSVTRHFISCFKPGGLYELQPVLYCYRPEVCIIGIKDRSGAWQARMFGFYDKDKKNIKVSRVYGNGLDVKMVRDSINSIRFMETWGDVYFPLPE